VETEGQNFFVSLKKVEETVFREKHFKSQARNYKLFAILLYLAI